MFLYCLLSLLASHFPLPSVDFVVAATMGGGETGFTVFLTHLAAALTYVLGQGHMADLSS